MTDNGVAKGGNMSVSSVTSMNRDRKRAMWAITIVFLLGLPFLNWAPSANVAGGDGHVIYAYVRSVIMDGDLQLENEYRHRWPVVGLYGWIRNRGTDRIIHSVDPAAPSFKDDPSKWGENYGYPSALFMPRTVTGHLSNQHAVGSAVLWSPFFSIGHTIAMGLSWFGMPVATDGFSLPYTILVSLGTALMVLAGMVFTYKLLMEFVHPPIAALAVLLVFLAGPLFAYTYQAPTAAHGPAMFTVACFLLWGMRCRTSPTGLRFLVWGLIGGLMIIVRMESATVFTLAGLVGLSGLWSAIRANESKDQIVVWAGRWLAFGVGLLVGVLPQVVTGWIIYGKPLITFYPEYNRLGLGEQGAAAWIVSYISLDRAVRAQL